MDTDANIDADELSRELDCFMEVFDRAGRWRVVGTLKISHFETTELVEPVEAADEAVRYIRKTINCDAGTGSAYEDLWRAQCAGIICANLPRMIEVSRTGSSLDVVMEYVPGLTLGAAVLELGGSVSYARAIFPQLCDAVSALHERFDPPIIHRDLKPSNIIVAERGPVIIDFGIARVWHDGAEADTTHFGTRCYAPPEQFGFGQTDARSDVYALGKILFFILTGQNPPNVLDERTLCGAGVPRPLAGIILRAVAFDPAQRYQDVRSLKVAFLGTVCAGDPVEPISVPINDASEPKTVSPSLAAEVSSLLARIPKPVGAIWSAMLLFSWGICALGSQFAIFTPNPHDAALPFWYVLLEYELITTVAVGATIFPLLDRRFICLIIPALRKVPWSKEALLCFCLVLTCIGIWIVASLCAHA